MTAFDMFKADQKETDKKMPVKTIIAEWEKLPDVDKEVQYPAVSMLMKVL